MFSCIYVDGAIRNAYYKTFPLPDETDYYDWGWSTEDPFVAAATGLFYLEVGYQDCVSSETAGEAGLYDNAGTFTVRKPSDYEGTSPVSGDRLYSSDSDMAVVGYHGIRVDTDVCETRYVGEITIDQGATVSFSAPGEVIAIDGGTGNVSVQGDENFGWVNLLDSRVVSNVVADDQGYKMVESPPPQNGELFGQLLILGGSELAIDIGKTRFLSMGPRAIWVYSWADAANVTVNNSEFWRCYKGIETAGETLTVRNCLFYRNASGCVNKSVGTQEESEVTNCTFDSNTTGVYSTQGRIVVRNCIFNNNVPALRFDAAGWQEDHNGFYDNSPFQGIIDENGQAVAINERSYPLGALPYDRTGIERSLWWIRSRDSLNEPTASEIVLEDAGSRPATDFNLHTESTNRYGIPDSGPIVQQDPLVRIGPVDVGYHPIMFFESQEDQDTLPDGWEVYYFGGTAGQDDDADGDSDGLANKAEYEQGTAPTAEDTDGDAWYDDNKWYGRDNRQEGNPDYRGDGIQDFGFVAGPRGYDPRRPPYLQNMTLDTQTDKYSISVYWGFDLRDTGTGEHSWSDAESSDKIWVRKSSESTFTSYAPEDAPDPLDGDERQFLQLRRRRINGLDPDSLYFYKIEFREASDAAPTFTPVYTFTTWALSPETFTFVAYGDNRGGKNQDYRTEHQEVMDRLINDNAYTAGEIDFIIHGGDMVYAADAAGASNSQWDPHFFYPAAKVIRSVPVFALPGNHEYLDADNNLDYFLAFFDYPSEDSTPPCNYDFSYGDALFLMMDTAEEGEDIDSAWLDELFDPLENPDNDDKKWRFVSYHIPGYTDRPNRQGHWYWSSDVKTVRRKLFPTTGKHLDDPSLGVTSVFCGHNHFFEHAKIGNGTNKLDQLVSGGGGARLYDPKEIWTGEYPIDGDPDADAQPGWRERADKERHYCVITVRPDGEEKVKVRVMIPAQQAPLHEFETSRCYIP